MIVIFDTETMGLPKDFKSSSKNIENWARPIELAWVVCDSELNIIKEFSSLIKLPDNVGLEPNITKLTGITEDMVFEEGFGLDMVLRAFKRDTLGRIVCGHNINFDINTIEAAWYFSHGVERDCNIFGKDRICTMELTTNICKLPKFGGSFKFPRLEEAYRILLGKEINGAHRALADVKATYEILKWLVDNKKLDIFQGFKVPQ